MAKIEIFECPGTNPTAPIYYPPTDFSQIPFNTGIDTDVFNYTLIQNYVNSIYPLNLSVSQGVTALTSAITKAPAKFVLVGASQGAQIVSTVFKNMTTSGNALASRLSDCLAIFLFGNPLRMAGTAFPGATSIPTGHGIAPAAQRLTNTTSYSSLIWEFANPGDPVCCTVGDDTAGATKIYNALQNNWNGLISSLGQGLGPLEEIQAVIDLIAGMASFHNQYFVNTYRPISGDSRPAYQICLDYLNKIAGPSYRADGWSTSLNV